MASTSPGVSTQTSSLGCSRRAGIVLCAVAAAAGVLALLSLFVRPLGAVLTAFVPASGGEADGPADRLGRAAHEHNSVKHADGHASHCQSHNQRSVRYNVCSLARWNHRRAGRRAGSWQRLRRRFWSAVSCSRHGIHTRAGDYQHREQVISREGIVLALRSRQHGRTRRVSGRCSPGLLRPLTPLRHHSRHTDSPPRST